MENMDPKMRVLAIMENMRRILGPVNPKTSYWQRRVNVALVDEQQLIALLRDSQDGKFHDR